MASVRAAGPSPGMAGGGGGARRAARQTVEFSLKGPVHVTLDEMPAGPPGCSVVDLLFNGPSQVSELVFHNYYTAWLTVLVRMLVAAPGTTPGPMPGAVPASALEQTPQGAGPTQPGAEQTTQMQVQAGPEAGGKARKESGWLVAVARRVLMPSPHLEAGSHDFVSILATESAVPWTELVGMRVVLRQPSPSWHTFHVEEIHVFAEPPRRVPWTRRHTLAPPAAAASAAPATPAANAVIPPGAAAAPVPGDQNAYDSILLLLRHQTLAALRSSAPTGPGPSGYASSIHASSAKGPATPTRARQVAAYEINSLPPV